MSSQPMSPLSPGPGSSSSSATSGVSALHPSESCSVSGEMGMVVQVTLGVLVGIVLSLEYASEWLYHRFVRPSPQLRSVRTAFFDGYKISCGALISHLFNILVAIFVSQAVSREVGADECAVYAIAFFFELSGISFVQLLQYCAIEYALQMSLPHSPTTPAARHRWRTVARPGIYPDAVQVSVLRVFLACSLTLVFALITFQFYNWPTTLGISTLAFAGACMTAIAPNSLVWQTLQWVSIKTAEKFIWTLFAAAQTVYFAEWSQKMDTGNNVVNAWLFIAIMPLILNTFMFLMFSRMSRLRFPCIGKVQSRRRLDAIQVQRHNAKAQQRRARRRRRRPLSENQNNDDNNNDHDIDGNANVNNVQPLGGNVNAEEEIQISEYASVNAHDDDQSQSNSDEDEEKDKKAQPRVVMRVMDISHQQQPQNNNSNSNVDRSAVHDNNNNNDTVVARRPTIRIRWNNSEAFKVGVLYMLVVNTVLMVMAWIYFFLNGVGFDVFILVLSMIIGPSVMAVATILFFQYLITRHVNVCL